VTPVTAPADRRFLRAHARPRRRRLVRPLVLRLVRAAVALGLIAFGAHEAATGALSPAALRIQHVVVRGNERLSSGEVLALLDGLRGTNIVVADLAGHRRRVLESPWVAEAVLRRVLPGTIEVSIVERRPLGIARLRGDLYLVDEEGTIIDEYGPKYAEFDLPIIDGLASQPGSGAPLVDARRAALAATVVQALRARPELASRLSQVDVSDVGDAVVLLDQDTTLLRIGDTQFLERVQSYVDLAPTLHERVEGIDYVDMRFGAQVFVGTSGQRAPPRPPPAKGPRRRRG
jgi:cell division septal protein FtsQ